MDFDIAILGSGFSGSITALVVRRIGLRPIVIDSATHPRFAIGESSTPIAGMLLRDLGRRHSLPVLESISRYGDWKRELPEVRCGRKRGFSYFQHRPGRDFRATDDHSTELLVTASADSERSDTQWFRADVDHLLVRELRQQKIEFWEGAEIEELTRLPAGWQLRCRSAGNASEVSARFVIDASGQTAVLPRQLGSTDATTSLRTRSRAIFSHFVGLPGWGDVQEPSARSSFSDHPFPCDDSAQHHLLEDAWMWLLRFDEGTTSAGMVIDETRVPKMNHPSAEEEWRQRIANYPSLVRLFSSARLAEQPGRLLKTSRLQRLWQAATGRDWAALPNTMGFIDPLHSSGIALSLCGIEKIAAILSKSWGMAELEGALRAYERTVTSELRLIDKLVAGCFEVLPNFQLFTAYSMLYFAAATSYEQRRGSDDAPGAFLCADDAAFVDLVTTTLQDIVQVRDEPPASQQRFVDNLARRIEPFNHVGLFAPDVPNMYRYTAAPD